MSIRPGNTASVPMITATASHSSVYLLLKLCCRSIRATNRISASVVNATKTWAVFVIRCSRSAAGGRPR